MCLGVIYTYDPNGNITEYYRNGSPISGNPVGMDTLIYYYTAGTNKLTHVKDIVPSGNYPEDIDNQNASNYLYDLIGNLKVDSSETLKMYWNTYHKLDSIYNWGDSTAMKFIYDPMNNRVEKRFYINAHAADMVVDSLVTYYIRDAQGNIMSIYEKDATDTLTWKEVNIYGSSRIGQFRPDTVVYYPGYSLIDSSISNIMSGRKVYELTNHLGNVLATVADYKLAVDTNGGGTDFFAPVIVSAQDYYPFGMLMPGRSFSSEDYRFGFNGKENDNEVKGNGHQQDYGMRIYDPRLGKFLSVDPLFQDFPWNSTYSFAENDILRNVDLDGAEKHPYQSLPQWAQNYMEIADGISEGLEQLVHDLTPLRYGDENDPENFSEAMDRILNLPASLAKAPSNLINVFENGSLKDKTKAIVGLGGIFTTLKSGKVSTSMLNVVKAGFDPKTRILTFIQGTKEKVPISIKVPDNYQLVKVSGSKAVVFKQKGKNVWITPDLDGHKGGTWKRARGKAENLFDKNTREGTYNADFSNRVDD